MYNTASPAPDDLTFAHPRLHPLIRAIGSLLSIAAVAAALGGCGSSSSSSSTTHTSTGTSTTATNSGTGPNTTRGLPGSPAGAKATPLSLAHVRIERPAVRPQFHGLENLTLTQKLTTLSGQVASFWGQAFQNSHLQLPPSNVTVVDQTAVTCGSQQIASSDPPQYCRQDGSIALPLQFIDRSVAPIGDAALALVVSDLYGYHVEDALGLLAPSAALSPADLEKTDSCLSGVYFLVLESQHTLTAGDESAVNTLLTAKAGPSGASGGTGVTASDLTAAFNKGIESRLRASVCLPQRATASSRAVAPPARTRVSARALRAHTASSPADFLATPAIATSWLPVHIGQWDFKVPPDHSYAATAANPSGIDVVSTGGAHFDVGILSGAPTLFTLDQIQNFIFSTGSEDTPGTQAQISATQGPFTGPAGSQEELIAWTGSRQDGTAVTGLVEIQNFGYGYVAYELGGPSATWSADLPTLLAIKANMMYTPAAAQ